MVKVLSVNGKIPLVDGKAISATGGGGGASLTDDDILECLIGTDMLSAVKDADGAILTDETGKIILM